MAPNKTVTLKDMAHNWLTSHQDESSGGWAERPGGKVNVLNTAEIMLALFASGVDGGNKSIHAGVKYLLTHAHEVPSDDHGAWSRDVQHGHSIQHIPDLVRTSLAIRALIKAGHQDEPEVRDGIAWILNSQNQERDALGWGYRRHAPGEIIPTCFALQALIEAVAAGLPVDVRGPIERGLNFLIGQHKNDGTFGAAGPMVGVRTIFAILTLQAASRHNLSVYSKQEKLAVEWVLANPNESRPVAEEMATIDPMRQPDGTGARDYGILYMPKLLTVQFQGLQPQAVRELLMDFNEDFDDRTGGFYGRRIFSWSTALALHALSAAQLQSLPERAPLYAGSKVGPAVLGFGISLVGAVVFLAAKQSYSLLVASTLVVVLLAVLVSYGSIKEKTFRELLLPVVKGFKGGS